MFSVTFTQMMLYVIQMMLSTQSSPMVKLSFFFHCTYPKMFPWNSVYLKDSFSFKMVLILITFEEAILESWSYGLFFFSLYFMLLYKSMRNSAKDFKKTF